MLIGWCPWKRLVVCSQFHLLFLPISPQPLTLTLLLLLLLSCLIQVAGQTIRPANWRHLLAPVCLRDMQMACRDFGAEPKVSRLFNQCESGHSLAVASRHPTATGRLKWSAKLPVRVFAFALELVLMFSLDLPTSCAANRNRAHKGRISQLVQFMSAFIARSRVVQLRHRAGSIS